MQLWLFFTIFGLVLFLPSSLLFLILNRFKNTIVVLIKQNGALKKIIITNKDLEKGKITKIDGKKVKPIIIDKSEIYYGKWRRWIVKPELDSNKKDKISDADVEEYLNNEDLLKLYLAGKFKDMLLWLLGVTIFVVIIAGVINGYLTISHQCVIVQDNSTREFIMQAARQGVLGK